MIYRILRILARISLSVFYRRIEVEGLENVPASGPILFVPNHTNALVDPQLLIKQFDRKITLTAKNVLGKNWLLGWVMKHAGVVAFHRAEDVGQGADRRQNVRSLQQCRDILAGGGAVCIFPEGVSHSDVGLRPFRLGPARLALDFARRNNDTEPLSIIPVGILYTAKYQFRSDVWLRFGEPIHPADWLEEGSTEALTEEIRRRVAGLTLDLETRRESVLLQWASEILLTEGQATPLVGDQPHQVSQAFELTERLRAGYRRLRAEQPKQIEELSRRVRAHRGELRRLGIAPDEVNLPMHWQRALLFTVRELELLFVGFPLALFGAINHLPPALLVRWIARATSRDADHWATNVIYPGAIIFPAYYILVLAIAWLTLPVFWAAIYSLALPYTGYYLLLMWDRSHAVFRRIRTFCKFLFHPELQSRLHQEQQSIIASIRSLQQELLAAHQETTESRPSKEMPAKH